MSIRYIALNRKDIFAICYSDKKIVYYNTSFTGEIQLYIYK